MECTKTLYVSVLKIDDLRYVCLGNTIVAVIVIEARAGLLLHCFLPIHGDEQNSS